MLSASRSFSRSLSRTVCKISVFYIIMNGYSSVKKRKSAKMNDSLRLSQVCAFPAQTVRKQTGWKHPAWREAPGMAGCRYSSAFGRAVTTILREKGRFFQSSPSVFSAGVLICPPRSQNAPSRHPFYKTERKAPPRRSSPRARTARFLSFRRREKTGKPAPRGEPGP